jgi:dolichol-phosphate mannosyltransferase
MAPNEPQLSVVVPLCNEADTVEELCERVVEACRAVGMAFEVVVVNDGSEDGTLDKLLKLAESHPELRVIDLMRNFGHMPALSAGLERARGQAIVVMDGDLQDPPELIGPLVEKWRAGAEVVYALRATRQDGFLLRVSTALFYGVLGLVTGRRIPAQAGTFGLMDRKVANALLRMPERNRYFAGLRAWAGGRQEFVTYDRPARASGRSRVGFLGLLRLSRTALLSFSTVPLRVSSLLALLTSAVLLSVGLVATVEKLFTSLAIPGWASTMVMIGTVGGVQSLVLFVLCEYVAVIFEELKQRPLYVVRAEFGAEAAGDDPPST